MGIFDAFKNKPKEPKVEDYLKGGPTAANAEKYKEAKAQYGKQTAAAKKPQAMFTGSKVPVITNIMGLSRPAEKDVFDPTRKFPNTAPYWASSRNRMRINTGDRDKEVD